MGNFEYKIIKHIAVLSISKFGWAKELNLVEWNGRAAVYDVRSWDPDHEKMSKGITITEEEMAALVAAMKEQEGGGNVGSE